MAALSRRLTAPGVTVFVRTALVRPHRYRYFQNWRPNFGRGAGGRVIGFGMGRRAISSVTGAHQSALAVGRYGAVDGKRSRWVGSRRLYDARANSCQEQATEAPRTPLTDYAARPIRRFA